MSTRILVAYASMFGTTQDIAEVMAQELRDADITVDVRAVAEVNDLSPYQAVVVGSAIYNGAWLPDAVHFLRTYAPQLQEMPVAYFAVCMIVYRSTPQRHYVAYTYFDSARAAAPAVHPVAVGLFAGKLRYRNLPLLERLIFLLKARLPSGDFRDWEAIRRWATSLHATLTDRM